MNRRVNPTRSLAEGSLINWFANSWQCWFWVTHKCSKSVICMFYCENNVLTWHTHTQISIIKYPKLRHNKTVWETNITPVWWDGWSPPKWFTVCDCFLCKHRTETKIRLSGLSLLCIDNYGLHSSTWPQLQASAPLGMTSSQPETGPWAVSQQTPCHTAPVATHLRFVYLIQCHCNSTRP